MKKKTVVSLGIGAALGAGIGVLLAPKSGKETRKDLKNKIEELRNKLKKIDKQDIKNYVEERINKIEEQLKDLDKEKVIKIAKEKAKRIEKNVRNCQNISRQKANQS